MDDRRQYFRIENKGSILAEYENDNLHVVNISSSGALVIKNDAHLDQIGVLKLTILNETLYVAYQILRVEKEFTTLIFTKEADIAQLFTILKKLKNQQQ